MIVRTEAFVLKAVRFGETSMIYRLFTRDRGVVPVMAKGARRPKSRFGASLGTSAPEIAVDLTALARGSPAIALGDALGSSLIDATLSIGIGPIVAPAAVTARLAVVGSLYALVAVAIVGTILSVRRLHDRRSAAACFALYLLAYLVVTGAD